MAQVQLSVSFTVNPGAPPPNPLTVTPSSASETLTVGSPADGTAVAVVSGGTAPYSYTLDSSSGPLPPGIQFAEDSAGNITLAGTPTSQGTGSVLLNITDSAGASAQLKMGTVIK